MKYRSKFELSVTNNLRNRKVKFKYEPHKFPYVINYNYTPDILLPNGVYVECKGVLDAIERRKFLAILKSNPKLDVRLLFQNARNKLNKKSKTTYGEWATKHNIIWAEKEIPSVWLK